MKRNEILSTGNYYKNQQLSKSKIIAWSHALRYKTVRNMLRKRPAKNLLDYGCGDGSFLYLNQDFYESAIGVDYSLQQILLNRERFKDFNKIRFITPTEIRESSFHDYFDLITCMETLEHCTEQDCQSLLFLYSQLLTPSGRLILSVPIEIGLSLLVKQLLRRLSAWRRIGDYKYMETYSAPEFIQMVFANRNSRIQRPIYELKPKEGEIISYHGHKGFNFHSLRKMIEQHFTIELQTYSPFPFLKSFLNSQAYFVCARKSP